jgi:plastocyanin
MAQPGPGRHRDSAGRLGSVPDMTGASRPSTRRRSAGRRPVTGRPATVHPATEHPSKVQRATGLPATGRHRAIAALGLALVLAAGGCLGATGGGKVPAGAKLITVYHMAFTPRVATVRVGQPVTWRFEDAGVLHNVTSRSGAFKSPDRDSGTWTHVFSRPGTYAYYCTIHPYMTATVVVTGS